MNREITAAIKRAYGVDGIRVSCRGGACRFYSDTNNRAAAILIQTEQVLVYRMNHMSVDEWVARFQTAVRDAGYFVEDCA